MRIVGGIHRGRRLNAPPDRDVRPTSDRVREALFDILAHRAEPLPMGASVADIFAGSGALGLEALSRGAARAVFLDERMASLSMIRANAKSLGETERATILRRDARRPGRPPFAADLLFMDPPYAERIAASVLRALVKQGWCKPGATVVVELPKAAAIEPPEGCRVTDSRVHGGTRLVFLAVEDTGSTPDTP